MSSTNHSPVSDQKSISPKEAAARTALESIADRRFTDGEWRQMRCRLMQFAHLLHQWGQPILAHDGGKPLAFLHPASTPQLAWNEAA